MKQIIRFLLIATLCGCVFAIRGATIRLAASKPAAAITISIASSVRTIPTHSLPLLDEQSHLFQDAQSDHSLTASNQPVLFRSSTLLNEIGGTSTPDPHAVLTEMGEANYLSIGRQAKGQIFLNNVSLGNQQNFSSCGEAAFVMGWNFQHPEQGLEIGPVETTGLEIGVYFPADLPGPHGYLGTSPKGMEAIGDFYADQYEQILPTAGNINLNNGDGYAQLEARGLLYSQLLVGNPLIIEVTDIIGSPSKTYNDSHYVILTGMNFDNGRVTYNDPYLNLSMDGKVSGYNRSVEWRELWASWSQNNDINPGESGHPGRGWYMVVH